MNEKRNTEQVYQDREAVKDTILSILAENEDFKEPSGGIVDSSMIVDLLPGDAGLGHVVLCGDLEQHYGFRLYDDELSKVVTLKDMIDCIVNKLQTN